MNNLKDNKLLYDSYNIYYEKGIDFVYKNNYFLAAKNLYYASMTLLKLAKNSESPLKERRFKRAQEIYEIAIECEKKAVSKSSVDSQAKSSKTTKNNNLDEEEKLALFAPVIDTGVSLDDVAGLEDAKEEIKQKVIEPNKHPKIFERYNKGKGGGILLYGVPGTGKTMLAQAIAHELDGKFFTVKCSDVLSKWFGEAEQNIRKLFNEARKYSTSIIFFDEFEALATKRDTNSTVMKRIVPELLAQIQGFEKNKNNLIVIAATNRPMDIDTAFLRPGRFDRSIYVPLPDEKARKVIIRNKLKNVPCDDHLDYEHIVDITNGFNGADVTNFCEKLKDIAIARELKTGFNSCINNNDVDEVRKIVGSTVFEEDLKRCAAYKEKYGY